MATGFGKKVSQLFIKFITSLKQIPVLLKDSRKRWRVVLPGIAVLAIAVGAIYYYEAIFLPSQVSVQQPLQTTVARRGNIILSAAGTGTLQAASQIDLSFKTSGTLTQMFVKVGDQVKAGQMLAAEDNSSQTIQLAQAKQTLTGLTSNSAIATAQQSIATATTSLINAENNLSYLISPPVYYWEQQITKDEQAVKDAQAAADAAPTDQVALSTLKNAQNALATAKQNLLGAQDSYQHTYIPNHFAYYVVQVGTNHKKKIFEPPTDADILAAHSAVTIAQGALTDAQNLYATLTGGNVDSNASGSGLTTLGSAQLAVQTAQDSLTATQLIAPFAGTVIAVNNKVGDSVGNSAVITVADMNTLFLKTYVDESDYALFKVGNSATVVFDALPDQTLTGKVVEVDPALNTSSGSAVVSGLVQLDPTTLSLLLGMGGSVTVISAQTQNAVLVPLAALHEYSTGKYAVFVMRNGKLTVQLVEIGLKDLVSAEIKSGLQVGDVISTGLLATK